MNSNSISHIGLKFSRDKVKEEHRKMPGFTFQNGVFSFQRHQDVFQDIKYVLNEGIGIQRKGSAKQDAKFGQLVDDPMTQIAVQILPNLLERFITDTLQIKEISPQTVNQLEIDKTVENGDERQQQNEERNAAVNNSFVSDETNRTTLNQTAQEKHNSSSQALATGGGANLSVGFKGLNAGLGAHGHKNNSDYNSSAEKNSYVTHTVDGKRFANGKETTEDYAVHNGDATASFSHVHHAHRFQGQIYTGEEIRFTLSQIEEKMVNISSENNLTILGNFYQVEIKKSIMLSNRLFADYNLFCRICERAECPPTFNQETIEKLLEMAGATVPSASWHSPEVLRLLAKLWSVQ